MMARAQRHGELVADLAPERAVLRDAKGWASDGQHYRYPKFEPERTHHFQDGCEFRVSLGRKRLVKALSSKARRLRYCDMPLAREPPKAACRSSARALTASSSSTKTAAAPGYGYGSGN